MSRAFTPPTLAQLSELLPAYDMEGFIAQGGMGAVYLARQKSLDRAVAIKVLPPELSADPGFRDSFQREARAMARLNHPNLIGVYDSGEVNGMLYIVMEYVAGESLYHAAFGKRLDPREAVRIVLAISRGLAHAHEAGIVHRDIKPANILLTPKAEPKIGDFGIAQPDDAPDDGLAMGTLGYTAPEVAAHPYASADPRADIYPLGVILYELLTGQRQRVGSPPPSAVAGTDAVLDGIWQRASSPHPQTRYANVNEMSAALENWLHPGAPAAGPKRGPAAGPRPRVGQVPVRSSSSGGGFGTWVAVVILLIVLYVVWNFIRRQRENAAVVTPESIQLAVRDHDSTRPPARAPLGDPSPATQTPPRSTPPAPGGGSEATRPDATPPHDEAPPSGGGIFTPFGVRYGDGNAPAAKPVDPVVGTWRLNHAPDRKITIEADGNFTLENGRKGTWKLKEEGVYRLTWDGSRWMELRAIGDEFSAKTDQFATFRLTRE